MIGDRMYDFIKRLYPICRSITGDGVRETLRIIKKQIPITINDVPSGTKVFDWTIPDEWNINAAYIKDSKGRKIVDFNNCNLHVLNYSVPINKKMFLGELKKHIFTLPDYPNRIPYLTSYYKSNWGFCMSHNKFKKLRRGRYEVFIDSEIKKGSLTYGELYIKGRIKDEVLFSCYVCHPSLCNDNLSGVALLTFLAKRLINKKDLKYSYRFLFIPETIGSITWLSINECKVNNIKFGLVAACVGDVGRLTYKKSRLGDSVIDRVVEKVLVDSGDKYNIINFFPYGSDERQFCSPGFNLGVGSLMRTPPGCFSEYHTSADNLGFIDSVSLEDSLDKYLRTVFVLENNATYFNINPKCEPQLGKRGLYRSIGSQKKVVINELAMLWVLNLSDGNNSLLDIAIISGMSFDIIKIAADSLIDNNLLVMIL